MQYFYNVWYVARLLLQRIVRKELHTCTVIVDMSNIWPRFHRLVLQLILPSDKAQLAELP